MDIRIGYEITYDCPQPTPMMLMLTVHPCRAGDLYAPDFMATDPIVPLDGYWDIFGNWCTRIVAPAGRITIRGGGIVHDSGIPEPREPWARQVPVEQLPPEVLVFLLGSRYCETDRLSDIAWNLFGHTPPGWARVEAIVDYVHHRLLFGYPYARATRTAWEAWHDQQGVCRDFAHLAVAFCRCMNIPARYCTGYLGDIGIPPIPGPMDFSAWFEAYLDGRWYSFDARHNMPRIGRVPIAYGRDATDVAISNAFGANTLAGFHVWAEEIV